jgi:WD40 repeat protein/sterol desaturase/sphingolipid hydroxylase (fatty acid hydroxylase superfamily)
MDLLREIGSFWLSILAWLAGLSVVFGLLARFMPCNPGMYWWKNLRAAGTDFLYWFVVPLFLRVARIAMLVAGVVLLFGGGEPGFVALKTLPPWLQCLAILFIEDVLLYWLHRLFHTRLVWKFHAIHHSPQVLDWMSATRFHPVNNLLTFSLVDVAMLLLGFSPVALLLLVPFNIVYSSMVHANLNWTFGPLRYLFASPVFHRWHHTTRDEGLDKNFASTFPFLDLLFGTFYMPAGVLPAEFGNGDPDFPEGFLLQFFYPFIRRETPSSDPQPRWSGGRLAVVLGAVSVLAVVGLLAGRRYFAPVPVQHHEQAAGEEEQAAVPEPPPEAGQAPAGARRPPAVLAVAISADGSRLVSGSEDGTVKVWDAVTARELLVLKGHTRAVRGVALSADGRTIVTGSWDGTVRLWDARTGREKRTLKGHTGQILGVAVSGDGRTVVSASVDFTAKVWDAATGETRATLGGPAGAVLGVAISGDGGTVISANGETVKVWDARGGQELRTLEGHRDLVYSVALSADGTRIVSGSMDGTVKVWDADTGKERLTFAAHKGSVYGVALSPDGNRIITGGEDQVVRVWDAETGQPGLTLAGHAAAVTSVAVSADGQRVVSGSRDGTLKVWNATPVVGRP